MFSYEGGLCSIFYIFFKKIYKFFLIISFEELEESEEIPVNVIDTLPCVWIRGGAFTVPVHRYYWIDNVKSIGNEYSTMKEKDCSSWLSKKKEQHKAYMAEVSRYYLEEQKQWNDMQKIYRSR